MNKKKLFGFLFEIVKQTPQIKPYLNNKARYIFAELVEYKTYDYYLDRLNGLVRGVYENNLGGEFIDIMASLIKGQLTQAYQQALEEQGFTDFILPEFLQVSLDEMILNQYDYVDQFFRDIIDARLDKTPIDPLLARASLWAQRWVEAYNEAVRLIILNSGGNLVWKEGDTIRKCRICKALDGIVAFASEWEVLGVRPQNAPNDKLTSLSGGKDAGCAGWHCDCSLTPTTRRRSPNAYGRIEAILLAR